MASKKSLSERIEKINIKYIWLVMIILSSILWIHPVGLPIPMDDMVLRFHSYIVNLPSGSIVYFDLRTSKGSFAGGEGPAVTCLWYDVFVHNLKPVFYTVGTAAAATDCLDLLNTFLKGNFPSKVYGTDYVYMGYTPAMESSVVLVLSDFQKIFSKDYAGTAVGALTLAKNIHNAGDVSMVISGGGAGVETLMWYVRNLPNLYPGKPLLMTANDGDSIAMLLPFIPSLFKAQKLCRIPLHHDLNLRGTKAIYEHPLDVHSKPFCGQRPRKLT